MPPKSSKKGAKKAGKKQVSGGRKRIKKKKQSYSIYIYKVMKQVHPDTGISSKAMLIMNSFVNDVFERIASEASRLAHYNKRATISSREIQTAVRLLLPGELAKHAVSEGTKAVTKFTSSNFYRFFCHKYLYFDEVTCTGVMADDDNEDPKHFNPHEDREKRKQVRYEYRELISETEKHSLEFTKPESRGLHKALDRAEELFEDVKQTREAVLDSRFLVLASQLGRRQVEKLQTHLMKFDPDIFAAKLITLMGGRSVEQALNQDDSDDDDDDDNDAGPSRSTKRRIQNLDWSKLGKMVTPNFRRTPSVTFMFGPLNIAPPVRKRAILLDGNKRNRDKPTAADKVTPSQLDKVESCEEATTAEVSRVRKYLIKATTPEGVDEDSSPVCLFKFIVNPHSFSQTIENMFHLSFLVKDGHARIDLDEDTGLPYV
ncbi:hypothetical protein QZH41_009747, partial [Actinostola sp. cb2023]